jgi:uncharacterized protein YhdP
VLQLPQLDVDAWWARLQAWAPEARNGGPPEPRELPEVDARGYLPTEATLRTGALMLAGRRFGGLTATLQRRGSGDNELWHATLQGDAAQGQVDFHPAGAGAPWPRWQARLARLAVPSADAAPTPLAESPSERLGGSATLPALDLAVDELEWRGHKLGRFELEGRPADGAAPRDWKLAHLLLNSADARFSASGQWSAAHRRMAADARLDLGDAGAALERVGHGKQVRGGKGRVQGQFSWIGSPLLPDWPTLAGKAQVNLDAGQFLQAEPGAARLLGVLSLQALPRRLTLDFRDVFQQGFAFDNLSGDIALERGIARSNNLRIRGVQAAVLIEGQADLQRQTQDLHLVVVPEINAGTASLAYAAINPAVGLGTFLAQLFLRKPLMQAGTREFHVTGPWAQPQVEPIERHADAPLPDLDSAAASAPAAR